MKTYELNSKLFQFDEADAKRNGAKEYKAKPLAAAEKKAAEKAKDAEAAAAVEAAKDAEEKA